MFIAIIVPTAHDDIHGKDNHAVKIDRNETLAMRCPKGFLSPSQTSHRSLRDKLV